MLRAVAADAVRWSRLVLLLIYEIDTCWRCWQGMEWRWMLSKSRCRCPTLLLRTCSFLPIMLSLGTPSQTHCLVRDCIVRGCRVRRHACGHRSDAGLHATAEGARIGRGARTHAAAGPLDRGILRPLTAARCHSSGVPCDTQSFRLVKQQDSMRQRGGLRASAVGPQQ